jgi:hypothetical protein
VERDAALPLVRRPTRWLFDLGVGARARVPRSGDAVEVGAGVLCFKKLRR